MLSLIHQTEHGKRNKTLALTGYGLSLKVERGQLLIVDGFANEGKRRVTVLPRANPDITQLLILGFTGTISLEALRWIMEHEISSAVLGPDGEIFAHLVEGKINIHLKRRQALAVTNGLDVTLVKWLLGKKFQGQEEVLSKLPYSPRTRKGEDSRFTLRSQANQLKECLTIEELRLLEAQVAFTYWKSWEGLPWNWPEWAKKRIPAHWLFAGLRASPLTASPRKAVNPTNALLNFCYTLLEVETRKSCHKVGLDPDLGMLHLDKENRSSFVFDLMEPLRPKVDSFVLAFILNGKYQPGDFHETREGICRVDPDLAVKLAEQLNFEPSLEELLVKVRQKIEAWEGEPQETQPQGRPAFKLVARQKKVCMACGKTLYKNRGFCNRACYREWCNRERPRENADKAHARLQQLRLEGEDPNQREEIRRKIAASVSDFQRRKRGNFVEPKTCKQCGKVFTDGRGKHFCSMACYDGWREKKEKSEIQKKQLNEEEQKLWIDVRTVEGRVTI